jgi:D-amino-acid dehydrogenase
MLVPSHFVPLAAPGMVARGLKWMWNPESPFYVKPRPSVELLGFCLRFWRAAHAGHVARSAPLLRDLHLASRACYEGWAAEWGADFGLRTHGLLMLCHTEHGLEEETGAARMARGLGVPAEVLDARQTAEREPALKLDVRGSVYYPLDAHLEPERLMAALRGRLTAAGVRIEWETEVARWITAGGRVTAVGTSRGERTADEYVICAGAWSAAAGRELGLKLPLMAGKGYSLTLPHPRRLPRLCAILTEARVAVTPMGGALRVGGTLELGGIDEAIDPARVRGIVKAVPRYFPELTAADFDGIEPWCGLRPCSPDGLPYLGRSRRLSNLCVATGHAMMGMSLGPVSGQLIAQLLSGEKPTLDLGLLDPDRYSSARIR